MSTLGRRALAEHVSFNCSGLDSEAAHGSTRCPARLFCSTSLNGDWWVSLKEAVH